MPDPVADDDPGVRQSLTRALRVEGYEVLEARDGVEGVERAGGADVMVLDVTMPNMSGFDVCRKLRADGDEGRSILALDEAARPAVEWRKRSMSSNRTSLRCAKTSSQSSTPVVSSGARIRRKFSASRFETM